MNNTTSRQTSGQIFRLTAIQTDRQAGRKAGRQAGRLAERQAAVKGLISSKAAAQEQACEAIAVVFSKCGQGGLSALSTEKADGVR